MKTRRGSSLWPETDGLSSMIYRFQPGDIVVPVTSQQERFLGVVKEVLPQINKVMVLWNGGSLKQHDPDEIMLEPHQNEIVRTRMASTRRCKKGSLCDEIMAAAGTFECPECGTKVLKNTGFCVKCKKKVKEATTGTFKCPDCGTKVLENTGYCVKCEKKVKQATTGTFKCPDCGTKVLKNTGYCVKCEKKVKEAAANFNQAESLSGRRDISADDEATKEIESEAGPKIAASAVPSLAGWNTYAGGTGVPEGFHSYDAYVGNYQYMISPFSNDYGRFMGYFLSVFPGRNHGHAGIDASGNEVMVNSRPSVFRSPQAAVTAAKAHGMALASIAASVGDLRSRRAMYWGAPDRVYRLTRTEQQNGNAVCPRCRSEMEKEPFTKSEKMYICPKCKFKVPTSKTTTTRVTIDVDEQGEVDVDVTTAGKGGGKGGARRGNMSMIADAVIFEEVVPRLPQMSLGEIASVVSRDWRPVNFAAKPYLDAMFSLNSVSDSYGADSGASIVAYFLANASSYRGEVAKAIKKELTKRLKSGR